MAHLPECGQIRTLRNVDRQTPPICQEERDQDWNTTGVSAHRKPLGQLSLRLVIIGFVLLWTQAIAFAEGPSAQDILSEVNLLRTQPQQYADIIAAERTYYHDSYMQKPGEPRIRLKEGVAALDEAVEFLRRQQPRGPLQISTGLCLGSNDHVLDQSKSGKTGHKGADGTFVRERIDRYGHSNGCGENLAYGPTTARDIVVQLVIDDGVPDRGHRTNFFNAAWNFFGSACGQHPTFRTMCAIAMASDYAEEPSKQTSALKTSTPTLSNSPVSPTSSRGPAAKTGNAYRDARASADGCLRAAINQDFSSFRNFLTASAKSRASTLQSRFSREAQDGWVYQFASTETLGSGFVRFRYLRKRSATSEPFFVSVLLERDQWLIDEISP